jgi:hypothetical protein
MDQPAQLSDTLPMVNLFLHPNREGNGGPSRSAMHIWCSKALRRLDSGEPWAELLSDTISNQPSGLDPKTHPSAPDQIEAWYVDQFTRMLNQQTYGDYKPWNFWVAESDWTDRIVHWCARIDGWRNGLQGWPQGAIVALRPGDTVRERPSVGAHLPIRWAGELCSG